MKNYRFFLFVCFLFVNLFCFSQEAIIRGVILDEMKKPISGAEISSKNNKTTSDNNGVYQLEVSANVDVQIKITHLGLEDYTFTINLEENQEYELNPILKEDIEQIGAVVISGRERKEVQGITILDPETIRNTPSANAGVEGLLKTLPGISSNNELSTQYGVRGGNFDENLVYVNEIEVYRPFLIRSGQQEGLSFVNSDLVRNVDFSAGGFQAKYGDKLSSVLDITYRRPTRFGASVKASLLGGSVAVGTITKNKKFAALTGVRYRDNSLLVNSQQTETNFRPRFIDAQTYLSYTFNKKFELGFLGNISINEYDYQPLTSQTNFGTLAETRALTIFYSGQEEDQYETYFGALKGTYQANENLTLKLIGSAYHTQEQEHYDILAAYFLGTVNNDIGSENLGEVEFNEGVGSQFTHARNDLDALIYNIEHKGTYIQDKHQFDWGIKYTNENIQDRIQEYEIVDSAGFSVRPPIIDIVNNQPYNPFASPIVPYNSVRATNDVTIERTSAFAQYSIRTEIKEHEFWANVGVRAQNWNVNGYGLKTKNQIVMSPRFQMALKPKWNADMVFRVSGGWYHQPPFYRELRDATGTVQPTVKAQESIHLVLGNDYSFKMWDRPFKLTSELFYKSLSDVNPYTIENVRIRYRANNNATAYATGLDMRLNGEFVPGTESWVSLGILKTEENINNQGYIARPTDQRLKIGVLFQDYVPTIPNLKMYLNLVYQTGVPGGSPSYADPYLFQDNRLRDYRRADLGTSYVFVDNKNKAKEGSLFSNFEELNIGFEIFNLFDNLNSITNTFVRDSASRRQFAIPNFLTQRIFNVKIGMRF